MNAKQFISLLAFLFIAVWAGPGLGDAVLCLLGAAVFYAGTAFYRRELELADLQQRVPRQQAPAAVRPRATHSRVR